MKIDSRVLPELKQAFSQFPGFLTISRLSIRGGFRGESKSLVESTFGKIRACTHDQANDSWRCWRDVS